ncbi:MAG: HAD family phosphatase [Solirubrobacteraceae bacterium]|nr:HAD family phosphatase [Solirubrobacteraceae bacterium]
MSVGAVVFDMDGVLVDSEHLWDQARRDLVAETGGVWPQGAETAMLGMSSKEWPVYVAEELHVPLSPAEINADVVRRMRAGYERELPLLPGAVAAVERLAAAFPLGLASSSNREIIDLVLAESGLHAHFTATVSSEEVAAGKPSPDVYAACVERLGADPAACVAVEDSGNGIRSAAAAGLAVIALPNPQYPPGADALALVGTVVSSLDELDVDLMQRVRR